MVLKMVCRLFGTKPLSELGAWWYTWSRYDSYCDTLLAIHSTIRYLRYIFLIFHSYRNYQLMKTYETGSMVRLVTVCSMISFLEIKRYQTFIVLKGATYVVFVFRSLLHWCFYVLILYSKPVPVWLSVYFLPLEQVTLYRFRHLRYDSRIASTRDTIFQYFD